MAADTNPASMASLSSAQLAERLEKSEAGRKKLRQAISILQEKLDATDKVLKANEMLRHECQQERKRAESEKHKAEEEKRLKSLLEKDSSTFKDQMAKVLLRLGAIENKQKGDKKEIERLRNEVKLSAEGMRVASQAVNAVQSSFENLETNLLEKVNAAFEEARIATQAVQHMQGSLQSMEQVIVKQGSSPNNELGLLPSGRAPEKLVDEISRLFNKERQSHCKIEHRLSMLKSVFKVGRKHPALTSAENIVDVESLVFSKKKKDKVSEKRRSRGEADAFDRRVRRRKEPGDVPAVNSDVNRLAFVGHKQADKSQSLSSPHLIVHQKTSNEPATLPLEPCSYNTASNDYVEAAVVHHRGSSNGTKLVQLPPKEATVTTQKEKFADPRLQISGYRKEILQNKGGSEYHVGDDHGISHTTRNKTDEEEEPERGFSASRDTAKVSIDAHFKIVNEANNFDLHLDSSDDSEEWWWSHDKVLLSPSLPEIASPIPSRGPSSVPSRELLPSKKCVSLVTDSSVNCKVLVNDASAVCDAVDLQDDTLDCNLNSTKACNNQLGANMARTSSDVRDPPGSSSGLEKKQRSNPRVTLRTDSALGTSTELGGKVLVQNTEDAGVSAPETYNDDAEPHKIDKAIHNIHPTSNPLSTGNFVASGVTSHETCPASDSVSKTTSGHGGSFVLGNLELTQLEGYMLESADDGSLAEMDKFLDVLRPLSDALSSEFFASDPSDRLSKELVCCPIDKVCTTNQPEATHEKLLSNAISKGETVEKSPNCTHVEDANEPISYGLPSQVESFDAVSTKDTEVFSVKETSKSFSAKGDLLSITKPSRPCEASSSCTVFLLQAIEIEEVDAKLELTAACIVVNNLESNVLHTNAQKGEVHLQENELYKTSRGLPMGYMACSIISSVVDVVRLKKRGAEPSAAANSIYALLQAYVAVIRSLFKEKANNVLNTVIAQLSSFLIQGEAMRVTFQGTLTPCEDALGMARVIHDKNQCTYEYFEATLEDIYAGGKVLAALCQVLACVSHLQNIVYEVLGWCDKEIMWLLTVFSSFSSICGHTAFMAEADDLLGHAICAIIVELVASVEQDPGKDSEPKVSEVTPSLPDVVPNHLVSWGALKEVLKINGTLSVKQVLVAALGTLQYILGSTRDPLSSSFVRTDLLDSKDCHANAYKHTINNECIDTSDKRLMEDSYVHREVSTACKSSSSGFLDNEAVSALKSFGPHKWQRKYMQAVGTVELIALFMGWDWTYNHLIGKYLWKMLAPGSTQICAAGVSHIFSILTRIAAKGSGVDLPGLADLKHRIIQLVCSTSTLLEKAEPFYSLI